MNAVKCLIAFFFVLNLYSHALAGQAGAVFSNHTKSVGGLIVIDLTEKSLSAEPFVNRGSYYGTNTVPPGGSPGAAVVGNIVGALLAGPAARSRAKSEALKMIAPLSEKLSDVNLAEVFTDTLIKTFSTEPAYVFGVANAKTIGSSRARRKLLKEYNAPVLIKISTHYLLDSQLLSLKIETTLETYRKKSNRPTQEKTVTFISEVLPRPDELDEKHPEKTIVNHLCLEENVVLIKDQIMRGTELQAKLIMESLTQGSQNAGDSVIATAANLDKVVGKVIDQNGERISIVSTNGNITSLSPIKLFYPDSKETEYFSQFTESLL